MIFEGTTENEPRTFSDLPANERFSILSSADDPSETLKHFCENVKPGTCFNQEGMDQCPKVLLIGAYEPTDLPAGRFPAPPFGLQRLASFLRVGGINAEVFDITAMGKKNLMEQLQREKYEYIGFSILGPTIPNDIQLIEEIKSACPDSILIAGGAVPTARPDLLQDTATDFLVTGYGEDPMLNLVMKKATDRPLDDIPGLLARQEKSGHVGKMAKVPTNRDLRIYSFLFDPQIGLSNFYTPTGGLYESFDSTRVNTFRFIGQAFCPGGCSFCSTRNFLKFATGVEHPPYIALSGEERYRVIANVLEKLPGVETIYLNDDDFFTDKKIAMDFFQRIIEGTENGQIRKGIKFICSSRLDRIDPELLQLAHKAGVIEINIGVESFHPDCLKILNKSLQLGKTVTPAQISDILSEVLEAGIIPSANLMIFIPDVEWAYILETVKGVVGLMEKGGEANMTTYVRVYHGADIISDKTIPALSYGECILPNNKETPPHVFWQDTVLLPRDPRMRELAKRTIIGRSRLEERYKRSHGWSYRRAPHAVVQLCFVKALLEEGAKMGLLDPKDADPLIEKTNNLINGEFGKLKKPKLPAAEQQVDGVLLSLTPEVQAKAREFKKDLTEAGFSIETIDQLLALRTDLLCNVWDMSIYQAIKPYLEYLFFGEEKSRFFHLDEFDRYVITQGILQNLVLSEQQKQVLMRGFGVDGLTQQEQTSYRLKLDAYIKHGLWKGPDDQNELSGKIVALLHAIRD